MKDVESGTAKIIFVGKVEKTGGNEATVRIFPEYSDALKGIENYSHLIILYWMHLRDNERDRRTLLVHPKRGTIPILTGVFACRSPSRPNPIGLSITILVKREGCMLTVKGLDAIEGSPIIDIKPYIPKLDSIPNAKTPEWV